MIWYLTTKDLMERYTKRSISSIEKTNYVVISSRVRITKDRDNVIQASQLFINGGLLRGVGMMEADSFLVKDNFKEYLLGKVPPLAFICSMIECSIMENEDTVLICSPNEMKTGYMKIIADVIMDLFHYPVMPYPEVDVDFDLEDVIKRLIYYNENLKKLRESNMSPSELRNYIQTLSKKELKKKLKKLDMYYPNMSKKDMIEALQESEEL